MYIIYLSIYLSSVCVCVCVCVRVCVYVCVSTRTANPFLHQCCKDSARTCFIMGNHCVVVCLSATCRHKVLSKVHVVFTVALCIDSECYMHKLHIIHVHVHLQKPSTTCIMVQYCHVASFMCTQQNVHVGCFLPEVLISLTGLVFALVYIHVHVCTCAYM